MPDLTQEPKPYPLDRRVLTERSKRSRRIGPLQLEPQLKIERQASDRTSVPDRTSIPDRTSVPDQTGARVWNHPGERQPTDDLTRTQPTRPISPTPLAQTREEVTELRGMISTFIDKSRNQEIAYRTIANRIYQAERELAEHRASAREINQLPSSPPRGMPNSLNHVAFSTLEFPSARSGRYVREN